MERGRGPNRDAALPSSDRSDRLYQVLGARCYALALYMLADQGEAEEVVQVAFTSVRDRARQFDEDDAETFVQLMDLTHRIAVEQLRRRSVAAGAHLAGDRVDRLALGGHSDADGCGVTLATLPQVEREVVLLAYFAGLTQRDIASRLEVTVDVVRQRMLSGMRRLRQQFPPSLPFPASVQ